jgi:glutamate formiminotransferase
MTFSVPPVLECVVNISEGRDPALIAELAAAGGRYVLDVHSDPDHHRSVLTVAGPVGPAVEAAMRALARAVVDRLDIGAHSGAHPRIGALDVVPFVALAPARGGPGRLADGDLDAAIGARDRFAAWAASALDLPCFLYGPERSLPELRRGAWTAFGPDCGPPIPHPTAGAAAVGARTVLVAYNLWLSPAADLARARRVAAAVRQPRLRTLGLQLGERVQVSCNLVEPWRLGPGAAFDAVVRALEVEAGPDAGVERAELVGLVPLGVLEAEPPSRWAELGLAASSTIEARLEQAGLDGGRF